MLRLLNLFALSALLAACGTLPAVVPSSGPTRSAVQALTPTDDHRDGRIQVIPIGRNLVRRMESQGSQFSWSPTLSQSGLTPHAPTGLPESQAMRLGLGDAVEVTLWEAPPAMLFGGNGDARGLGAGRTATLPEQVIDADGEISLPFGGRLEAAGRTLAEVEKMIVRRLDGRANQPQAMVRLTRPGHASVTVVGEVASSLRMPLTPRGERLLDALAAAGGARQPVSKVSVQLTRSQTVHSLPLDALISDPRLNVRLQAGDVVTVLAQPLSFVVLGATGRNDELPFEAQGLTLAQALARAGGLNDARADARGVFVFRLEDPAVLPADSADRAGNKGRVPVVYVLDLSDPASLFVAQGFPIKHRDVLYVSNAPAAELQKFLNLVWGAALPALNLLNLTR